MHTISEPIWKTFDKRTIAVRKLDDQHLINIYWYNRVFFGRRFVWDKITKEILKRFGSIPLTWKPLPIPEEIKNLKRLDCIVGTDIIFEGMVIGSISHIDENKLK